MRLEALTSKYIASAEKVLGEMEKAKGSFVVDEAKVGEVIEWVRAYLTDAKYYKAQERLETSLTAVAYCEGLLDALRLLGAVEFEWPTKPIDEK
jgi:FAD synthetase